MLMKEQWWDLNPQVPTNKTVNQGIKTEDYTIHTYTRMDTPTHTYISMQSKHLGKRQKREGVHVKGIKDIQKR